MVGRGDRTQATAATEEGSTERTQRGGGTTPHRRRLRRRAPPRARPESPAAAPPPGQAAGSAGRRHGGGPAREARRRSGAAEAGGAAEEAPKDGEGERRAPTPHYETEKTYWSRLDKAADREEPGTPRSGRGGARRRRASEGERQRILAAAAAKIARKRAGSGRGLTPPGRARPAAVPFFGVRRALAPASSQAAGVGPNEAAPDAA